MTTPPPAPLLSGITPTTVTVETGDFTRTATGQNFLSTSVVRVNGSARATTFGSSTALTATGQADPDVAAAFERGFDHRPRREALPVM